MQPAEQRPGLGIVRVALDRGVEAGKDRLAKLVPEGAPVGVGPQHAGVARHARLDAARQAGRHVAVEDAVGLAQHRRDAGGELRPDAEQGARRPRPVVGLAPDDPPRLRVEELRPEPHGRRVGADAALDDVADPEVAPQRYRVGTRVLAEARRHRIEPEALEPHQGGDELLGHAGGKEAVVLAGAERLEGQDDNRRTAGFLAPDIDGPRSQSQARRPPRGARRRAGRPRCGTPRRPRPAMPAPSASSAAGAAPVCPDNRPTSGFAFGVIGGRRLRRRLVPFEMRDVLAFRNGDTHGVPGAGIDVVAVKVASQAPGFETDNRIGLDSNVASRPKTASPTEYPFSLSARPASVSSTRYRRNARRRGLDLERRTVQDTLQLRADLGRRRTRWCSPATGGVGCWGYNTLPSQPFSKTSSGGR